MQLRPLVIAAGLFLTLSATGSAQVPALEKGSMLIGGTAGVQFDTEEGEDEDTWTITALPRIEYFIARGLAVGGEAGVTHARQDDASFTTLLIGPAASYYFVRSGRTHPYVRGSFNYARASSSAFDDSFSTHRWTGAAGLLMLLGDAVGVDAQLFVSRLDADAAGTNSLTTAGLRFGVSAFVF